MGTQKRFFFSVANHAKHVSATEVVLEDLDHTLCPLSMDTTEICKHFAKPLFLFFPPIFFFFLIPKSNVPKASQRMGNGWNSMSNEWFHLKALICSGAAVWVTDCLGITSLSGKK